MTDATKKTDPLAADFAALKDQATRPGDDLMARVLADADVEQAAFLAPQALVREPARGRFWAMIGGWPSMAGLATAGIAGVWIGMAQPAMLVAGSEALLYGDTGVLDAFDTGLGLSGLEGGL
ncbi:MAG: dihydroorotate dehydrogenase [Pseudomonadota bacterium]